MPFLFIINIAIFLSFNHQIHNFLCDLLYCLSIDRPNDINGSLSSSPSPSPHPRSFQHLSITFYAVNSCRLQSFCLLMFDHLMYSTTTSTLSDVFRLLSVLISATLYSYLLLLLTSSLSLLSQTTIATIVLLCLASSLMMLCCCLLIVTAQHEVELNRLLRVHQQQVLYISFSFYLLQI